MRTEYTIYEISDHLAPTGRAPLGPFAIIVPVQGGLEIRTLNGRALHIQFPDDEVADDAMLEDWHEQGRVVINLPEGKLELQHLTLPRFKQLRGFVPESVKVPEFEDDGDMNAFMYALVSVAGDQ